MNLDSRTIMVLFSMLSIMFAGLILLARLNTKSISSVKQWSIANLCIGLAFSSSYFCSTLTTASKLAIVVAAALVSTSVALQFTGIQSFKESKTYQYFAIFFVGLMTFQTYWFEFLYPDASARSIANSLVLSAGYAACAGALLISNKSPLKTVSWFTGLSFSLLSAIMLIRAVLVSQSSLLNSYSLYTNAPVNQVPFIITCVLQLCVTFGFLLMLNQQLVAEIEKTASRDTLTGAFNRRRLEEEVKRLTARFNRTGDNFSLMLIDVDNFKFINDNYGHPNGDEVLRSLSTMAISSIRADDYFARYGGDEFCIALPSTSADEAMILAERLREAFSSAIFVFDGHTTKCSISIGIAESTKAGAEFVNLIASADQALYMAKNNGRNKVIYQTI